MTSQHFFTWTTLIAVIAVIAVSGALADAAPPLNDLVDAMARHRAAFEAQTSYKYNIHVDSELFIPRSYAYKSFDIIEARRGDDLSTTVLLPAGCMYENPNFPEMKMWHSYHKGIAVYMEGASMQISPEVFTQQFQYHEYTDYQHINIYKRLPKAAGNFEPFQLSQPFLPEWIQKNQSKYSVRPTPEVVDGISCWVVECPDVDLIWLDQEEKLIRKRELRWGPKEPLSLVTYLQEYDVFAPNLKLPRRIVAEHYSDPNLDPAENKGKLTCKLTISMKGYAVGTVEDKDFHVEAPPGEIVNDYIRRVQYVVPYPGDKPFERAIELASIQSPSNGLMLIAINAIVFGIVLMVFIIYRIRALKTRKSPSA